MGRWIGFFIAIIAGIAGGLYYGWVLNPVQYIETTPDTLRIDYQSDYVLMVAEAYQVEDDLDLALRRLALLGADPATEIVLDAILFAENQGYTEYDLALMRALLNEVQIYEVSQGVVSP